MKSDNMSINNNLVDILVKIKINFQIKMTNQLYLNNKSTLIIKIKI